ncbi:MAG: hypothetical protein EBZ48_17735, partial [Proteobacteria bacterium]|nr:hypothetical protein [Pseudomonadota bacterium]
ILLTIIYVYFHALESNQPFSLLLPPKLALIWRAELLLIQRSRSAESTLKFFPIRKCGSWVFMISRVELPRQYRTS